METLPDDQLAMVMSFLTAAELLQCRAVCRRWRDLLLLPVLWARKKIGGWPWKTASMAQMLRLAPCAAEVEVEWPEAALLGAPLLLDARCAAASLSLLNVGEGDAVLALLALRRQAALKQLRALRLECDMSGTAMESPNMVHFLSVVDSVSAGLRELDLKMKGIVPAAASGVPPVPPQPLPPAIPQAAAVEVPAQASLRKLRVVNVPWPRLAATLRQHADTLEEVCVEWGYNSPRYPYPELAEALLQLPRLRALRCCHGFPRMRKLSGMTSLKALYLDLQACCSSELNSWADPPLDAAKAFLRDSTSTLEELEFNFQDNALHQEEQELFSAVGSGHGPAALRVLLIGEVATLRMLMMIPVSVVVPVLHRLSALRVLSLGYLAMPSDALLAAIRPALLPHLELLSFRSQPLNDCAVHGCELGALMESYRPALHIVFLGDGHECGPNQTSDGDCVECLCPDFRRLYADQDPYRGLGLYAHTPEEPCEVCGRHLKPKHRHLFGEFISVWDALKWHQVVWPWTRCLASEDLRKNQDGPAIE